MVPRYVSVFFLSFSLFPKHTGPAHKITSLEIAFPNRTSIRAFCFCFGLALPFAANFHSAFTQHCHTFAMRILLSLSPFFLSAKAATTTTLSKVTDESMVRGAIEGPAAPSNPGNLPNEDAARSQQRGENAIAQKGIANRGRRGEQVVKRRSEKKHRDGG